MPVGVIMDFTTDRGPEAYDNVIEKMDLGGHLPAGAIFHAAGPSGDGWRVVDVWQDQATFQAFAQEKIGPITAEEGLPEPAMQFVEVDEMFDERGGGDGGVTFLQVVRLDGMDRAAFQEADSEIRDEQMAPDGCMFHINGPTDTGWIVVDAWTTKDVRDQFIADKVAPAMQARGIAPPAIEDMEMHNTLAPV